MQLKQLLLLSATVGSAFGLSLQERQASTDPALAPLANVPSQCTSQCAILQQYNSIDPNNLSTLAAVCTSQAQQQFGECLSCFETYSPQTFTSTLMTALQSAADQIGTGCLLVGSPISSIPIPSPTATGSSGNSNSTGGATQSAAASTTSASHGNGSLGTVSYNAMVGVSVAMAALGAIAYL